MVEIRVIITNTRGMYLAPGGGLAGNPVQEVDMSFVSRSKTDAHEYFERALTAFELQGEDLA